ncbi:hypothetical protein FB451DRAFT_1145158 [Mycena latifolia]|nr:hypothetical protein FB451DRAFT_1145158 [Mycena latifolia]
MCWPRSLCCRCPKRSSFPWPPCLSFGRTPRRPAIPQLASPWNPWPSLPPVPMTFTPGPAFTPPAPPQPLDGPRSPWPQVRFTEPPPPIELPPAPEWALAPFIPQMPPCPQPAQPVNLSPALCSPRGAYPYLDWDLAQFPSAAQLRTTPHSQKPAPLDAPATFPSTCLLTLSFADSPVLAHWEHHWGPIFARGQGAHALTVEDVLDAVHAYFNTPLTPEDHALVTPHAWGLISDAYRARLPHSPNMRAYDAHRGALRLDVLNGATKFGGLHCAGRDHFHLMLAA